MSLVTLSSKRNTAVQRDTDPAIIKNYFKDGLVLREGTEVGLVSLTINKLDLYEVIAGQNDTFIWRIGNEATAGSPYFQHTVTVSEGNYTGDQLATEIQTKVNASTLLGNYKGEWVCTFDQTGQGGEGAFTLNYGQKEPPAAPTAQTYETYSGGTPVFPNNGTASVDLRGAPAGLVDDFIQENNPLIVTGKKGIFPNDGDFQMIIRPQEGYSQADQKTALQAGGSPVDETTYVGGTPTTLEGSFNLTTGAELAEGWELVFQYTLGTPELFFVYLGDGEWGASLDGTQTATRATCQLFYFWNPTRGVFADAANGGRHTEIANTGRFYIITGAVQFVVPQSNLGYGTSMSGFARDILYNGRDNYPGDANALITNAVNSGFDINIECKDNDDKDGVLFSLGQIIAVGGTESTFPKPNWRGNSAAVFSDVDPETGFTSLPTTPDNWTSFSYGTDHISMTVEITKVTGINIYLGHDNAGDNVFTDNILVSSTSGAGGFNSQIKEIHYSLRPCMAVSRGNQYFSSRYILKGKYDETEIINPNLFVDTENAEPIQEDLLDTPVGVVPANAQTLSVLYKFGEIYASDMGGTKPNGGLKLLDLTPTGNINTLIGFNRFYNFGAGQTTNSVASTNNPITNIAEPTLSLELPDFNIKGANGNTGDSMRVIAVVPKEELSTNEKTGTLHYYPAFPVMIDLNLPQEQIFYDLNAILRLPDGRVANDLINPTEITLLFKEGEESKQRRMMKEQVALMSSMMGNKQSAMIGGIGSGNPLV